MTSNDLKNTFFLFFKTKEEGSCKFYATFQKRVPFNFGTKIQIRLKFNLEFFIFDS